MSFLRVLVYVSFWSDDHCDDPSIQTVIYEERERKRDERSAGGGGGGARRRKPDYL